MPLCHLGRVALQNARPLELGRHVNEYLKIVEIRKVGMQGVRTLRDDKARRTFALGRHNLTRRAVVSALGALLAARYWSQHLSKKSLAVNVAACLGESLRRSHIRSQEEIVHME